MLKLVVRKETGVKRLMLHRITQRNANHEVVFTFD
jgi:hypothetical protein